MSRVSLVYAKYPTNPWIGGVLFVVTGHIKGLEYIWKKQEPKVCAFNKYRDITNTLPMTVCLFKDKINAALQGRNIWGHKDVWV